MKIRITWKDPDAVSGAIEDVIFKENKENGVSHSGHAIYGHPLWESLGDELSLAGIGEYITLEYDTETKQVIFIKD